MSAIRLRLFAPIAFATLLAAMGCKGEVAASHDAMVESGAPARLQFVGGSWAYDREVPKRAKVYFDNATKEQVTIRMPNGDSFRVAPGGTVALTTPTTGFTFDRVHTDGRADPVGPYSLVENGVYIYDVDAVASYELVTQSYSSIGAGSLAGPQRKIVGAFLFAVDADFILAPLPDTVTPKADEAVSRRTAIQRTYDGNPKCTHLRADAGGSASACALDESEWTVQVRGESDAPNATVYVDDAYTSPMELRVDGVSVAMLKAGSLTRVHLSPTSHVLAAYDPHGTLHEQTTQALGAWKNYVWTPEKRRNFTIESRDYGESFSTPGLGRLAPQGPRRLDAPGFFETDADFLFAPFPDSIKESTYAVGATRKRLARVGAPVER